MNTREHSTQTPNLFPPLYFTRLDTEMIATYNSFHERTQLELSASEEQAVAQPLFLCPCIRNFAQNESPRDRNHAAQATPLQPRT